MSDVNYNIIFFGHNTEPSEKTGEPADKIWGYVEIEEKIYNFWARRNGTLNFKRWKNNFSDRRSLNNKCSEKKRNGYKEVSIKRIDTLWPGFEQKFKRDLFNARMLERVKNENS